MMAVIDAIPVVSWDLWAPGRTFTTDEFRHFVYEWVASNAALYRYAQVVAGAPNLN